MAPPPGRRPREHGVKNWVRRRSRLALERALSRRGYALVQQSAEEERWTQMLVDRSLPLPPGAYEFLRPDNPQLVNLRATYDRLGWPASMHSRWEPTNFVHWLDLRYFRGD